MSAEVVTATTISVRGGLEHLPRIRRIAYCMAEGLGMTTRAASEAASVLADACADALRRESESDSADGLLITINRSRDGIEADVSGTRASAVDLSPTSA